MAQQAAPPTVLLVEDEPSTRRLIHRLLLSLGYQLLEASDGNQALEVVDQRRAPLDLLLTDVIMPKMNGFTLAARVTSRHPETRVLFITGQAADRPDVEDTLRKTPHTFLLKPFTATALTQKVQYLLLAREREGLHPWHPPAAPRFIKVIPVLYRPSDQTAWLRGLTIDVSDSGFLLEAVSALAPGSRLDLTFETADAISSLGSGTLRRSGRVVRNGTPRPSIPYPVGIQFISPDVPRNSSVRRASGRASGD